MQNVYYNRDVIFKILDEEDPKTGGEAIRLINSYAPVADVKENFPARWIVSSPLDWYSVYKCSNCNAFGNPYNNFCPNCGAKMILININEVDIQKKE